MNRLLLFGLLSVFVDVLSLAENPNIVLILADDLGVGDVDCYGGDRCLIETPNIDRLASEGLRFTNAYANASTCVPTRRALLTGRYSWRFGPAINSGPWGFMGPCARLEKHTIGKLLKQAGYRTGYVGKWHLGTRMARIDAAEEQGPENVDFSKPLEFGPFQFGFDESFILPGSLDMYPYAYARNHVWQGEITAQKGWSAFNRIGPAEKDFQDHEVLETFYREAKSFIDEQQSSEPFFLYLALTAPHTPTSPGVKWRGKSELGTYGDFVMEVDHGVQRVIKALQANGLDDNTLLLFSSDHGPAPYAGNVLKATPGQIKQLETLGHYPSGPHRGYKFSIYEGGLRVPLLARWPGKIQAGSICESIVGLCDIMATFADLTGQKLASDQAPDSISFAEQLTNPLAVSKRTSLIMEAVVAYAIREGKWKLILSPSSGVKSGDGVFVGNDPMPTVAWKAALKDFEGKPTEADLLKPPFVQLFDLSVDLHEDHNLAQQNPERVADMVALLEEYVSNGRSTLGPKLSNDKPVNLVNLRDKRLPEFVRALAP
ncbi:MAG: arylsulfatase [Planctomycetota bacterium]